MSTSSAPRMETRSTVGPGDGAAAQPVQVRLVGRCDVPIWGERPAQRSARAFARIDGPEVVDHRAAPSPAEGRVVLVRADAVLDWPIVEALPASRDVLLLGNEEGAGEPLAAVAPATRAGEVAAWLERGEVRDPPPGLEPVRPQELGSSYWRKLRKREVPYAMRATPERVRAIEWRIYQGTYKGVTDLVTKYLWPVPAFWGTRLCARAGIHPNVVTLCSLALVILAYVLFQAGQFAAGLAAAWVMALLDTVDGKLARVTMTSSRFGNVLDHGIDLIHPPFWYAAWRFGLDGSATPAAVLDLALVVTIAGYVALRLVEGAFKWRFGMHIHVWRRFDATFRLIVSRRNPNIVLLTVAVLLGRPDLGLVAVAVWTAISVLVHLVQLTQAVVEARGGRQITSWLADEPAT